MDVADYIALLDVIIAALIIDLTLGEPPRLLHPTHWIGVLASWMDARIPRGNPVVEKLAGIAIAILLPSLSALAALLFLSIIKFFLGKIAWILASAYVFKLSFAIKDMERHVKPVVSEVEKGDIHNARLQVSRIVRRDVSRLEAPLVLSAAVESTSESIVDGFCSPAFFFMLAGIPGSVAYRAVNTLDSTVGYKDEIHRNVGLASARLDDVLNFIPARLSVLFIALASMILGADWKGCLRTAVRDHGKTSSPNSGWPMAAMAGALKVRLEKKGEHVLGDEHPFPGLRETLQSLKIMRLSCLFFYLVVTPLALFMGFTIQLFLEDLLIAFLSLLR